MKLKTLDADTSLVDIVGEVNSDDVPKELLQATDWQLYFSIISPPSRGLGGERGGVEEGGAIAHLFITNIPPIEI